MKWYNSLMTAGAIVIAALILAVTLVKINEPEGLDEWKEGQDITIRRVEQPPVATPTNLVQHPVTEEWVTREQIEIEKKIIEAMLCNQGREEYC